MLPNCCLRKNKQFDKLEHQKHIRIRSLQVAGHITLSIFVNIQICCPTVQERMAKKIRGQVYIQIIIWTVQGLPQHVT